MEREGKSAEIKGGTAKLSLEESGGRACLPPAGAAGSGRGAGAASRPPGAGLRLQGESMRGR